MRPPGGGETRCRVDGFGMQGAVPGGAVAPGAGDSPLPAQGPGATDCEVRGFGTQGAVPME